jgi:hypothetical protein
VGTAAIGCPPSAARHRSDAKWKSGASAPRKEHKINAGFSPCGRVSRRRGAFSKTFSSRGTYPRELFNFFDFSSTPRANFSL